ncbi:hypothetical protein PIIN_01376 [Serendipita indica DSM 11827]|uniref:Uncharacterized protein n=1 Tax=Serendipita indica (strain DSM 11827) TaxID=1109443 RepID=G4T882_SERID|nr:hypothetical protein PIIN_01376 [Serendipita indica DSM 11827]
MSSTSSSTWLATASRKTVALVSRKVSVAPTVSAHSCTWLRNVLVVTHSSSSNQWSMPVSEKSPPMFYEISIECLLHLAGLKPRRARELGLMPTEGELWRRLILRLKESEHGQFLLFGQLAHRYFGGNEALLARPVTREPNLSGDLTPQLNKDVQARVPSGMLQLRKRVIANWA